MPMGSIKITLEFESTKMDLEFQTGKSGVVALFSYINSQMALLDDPTALKIAGFTTRLTKVTDDMETATKQPQGAE